MTRTAGNTSLGRTINRVTRKTERQDTVQFNSARAIILKPWKDSYVFYMALLDKSGRIVKNTQPIALAGTEEQLAMLYGSPQNLSRGQGSAWEVIVFYTGNSVNKGIALVARRLYEVAGGAFEAVKTANELVAQGTSWAPPGTGMV
jgi:hypothetical protein